MFLQMFTLILILANQCFASNLLLRIHGGIDAKPDDYPYVVRMEKQRITNYTNNTVIVQNFHHCTASALSPVWLLSAGHCLAGLKELLQSKGPPYVTEKIVIRHGHVKDSPWIKDSFSEILFTVMHPLYRAMHEVKHLRVKVKHDIGLLKTTPMNIISYMKLSAVDYKSLYGHEAVMAGYGLGVTKINSDGRIETNHTLKLQKPLQLVETMVYKCVEGNFPVPGLCLVSKCKDKRIITGCPGDSGGPIIHLSGLIGIVSMGDVVGQCYSTSVKLPAQTIAAIVPVSPYIEWIYSIVDS